MNSLSKPSSQVESREQGNGSTHKFDLSGLSVMLAMPAHRNLHPATVTSMLRTQELMFRHGVGITIDVEHGGPYVECVRDRLAQVFLDGKWNRLAWCDSDMAWHAESFLRLLALSTELEVVGAAYVIKRDPPSFATITGIEEGSPIRQNKFGCLTTDALKFGLGFTIVHRTVIEQLAAKSGKMTFGLEPGAAVPDIFHNRDRERPAEGFPGEDGNFFNDCRALGYDVWLDPEIQLGHIGPKIYTAALKDHLRVGEQDTGAS